MNKNQIIQQLHELYPGKAIFCNPEDNTTEIICEIDPCNEHPETSVAIAVIDKSAMHYHQNTTETYELLNGNLTLYVDGNPHHLSVGETYTIMPNHHHCAIGETAWVKVTSHPGWTTNDHILIK